MQRDGADPVAKSLSKIFCKRASFELKEDEVQAYRKHIDSLQQQVAQVAAKTQENEEYRTWKVGYVLKAAKSQSVIHRVS